VISGCILAKSKFYGNSLSAFMDGSARLVFLNRGEEYIITMPYAHCKGERSACRVHITMVRRPLLCSGFQNKPTSYSDLTEGCRSMTKSVG